MVYLEYQTLFLVVIVVQVCQRKTKMNLKNDLFSVLEVISILFLKKMIHEICLL